MRNIFLKNDTWCPNFQRRVNNFDSITYRGPILACILPTMEVSPHGLTHSRPKHFWANHMLILNSICPKQDKPNWISSRYRIGIEVKLLFFRWNLLLLFSRILFLILMKGENNSFVLNMKPLLMKQKILAVSIHYKHCPTCLYYVWNHMTNSGKIQFTIMDRAVIQTYLVAFHVKSIWWILVNSYAFIPD